MTPNDSQALDDAHRQAAYVDLVVKAFAGKKAIAFTKTMKQAIPLLHPSANPILFPLNTDIASKQMRYLMNGTKRRLLGNRMQRHNARLASFYWIESSVVERIHGHGLFEVPAACTYDDVCNAMQQTWARSEWSRSRSDYKNVYDCAGWVCYNLKQGVKTLDLRNLQF